MMSLCNVISSGAVDLDGRIEPGDMLLQVSILVPVLHGSSYFFTLTCFLSFNFPNASNK